MIAVVVRWPTAACTASSRTAPRCARRSAIRCSASASRWTGAAPASTPAAGHLRLRGEAHAHAARPRAGRSRAPAGGRPHARGGLGRRRGGRDVQLHEPDGDGHEHAPERGVRRARALSDPPHGSPIKRDIEPTGINHIILALSDAHVVRFFSPACPTSPAAARGGAGDAGVRGRGGSGQHVAQPPAPIATPRGVAIGVSARPPRGTAPRAPARDGVRLPGGSRRASRGAPRRAAPRR